MRRAPAPRPGDLIDFDVSDRWRLSRLNTREAENEYFHDGKAMYGHVLVLAVDAGVENVLVYINGISPLWVHDAYAAPDRLGR